MILGTDAAGVAPDGTEVVVHGVIGADGHGVGPREPRSLLSERYPGTLAERVSVPTANLVPKPAELSFEEAACLPTAWLTAYRMLFVAADLNPGDRVLVQGAGGGVATAAIVLGAAGGLEVVATSRSEAKRERALALGAADFCLKPIDPDWVLARLNALQQGRPLGTILIIDDEEADRLLMRGLLTAQGRFAIVEASSGEAGLLRAREAPPDAIILDLVMADMTGFEVLERLRVDDRTAGVPVIINTSADLGEEERRRLAPRSAAILSKSPVPAEEAFATIRDALIRAGLRLSPAGTES
jgi:NADPH:quinone reductase-like Zn-dependent oxidoreductase